MHKKIALFLSLVVVAALSPLRAEDQIFAFKEVNIIPMTSEKVLKKRTVIVKHGKIALICKKGCIPDEAIEIDGFGKYLSPGLADMHAHVAMLDNPMLSDLQQMAARAQSQQLRQYLLFGVTTIRDVSGTKRNLSIRDDIFAGKAMGPRIYTSSRHMDGDPPLMFGNATFGEPNAAITYVHESAKAGFDMIKTYSTLKPNVFAAIVDTAKEEGLRVGGHVPMQVSLESALKAGMRSIEHSSGFDVECARGERILDPHIEHVYQGWANCTPDKIAALAEMTAKYDVWVVPTLVAVDSLVITDFQRHTKIDEISTKYTPPSISTFRDAIFSLFSADARSGIQGSRDVRLAIVKALSDKGASLLTGSDTSDAGYNIHTELALFVEAGLSPYQALLASTAEPARYAEAEGEFGTIIEGASADLVLLEENPLEDISNIASIAGVMVRGEWMGRERLDIIEANLMAEYDEDRLFMKEAMAKMQQPR